MITKKTLKQMQQVQAHLSAGNKDAALRMAEAIRRAASSAADMLYLDLIIIDLKK